MVVSGCKNNVETGPLLAGCGRYRPTMHLSGAIGRWQGLWHCACLSQFSLHVSNVRLELRHEVGAVGVPSARRSKLRILLLSGTPSLRLGHARVIA